MAWHYDGQGISFQGLPHSAESLRLSYLPGDPTVAFSFAIGNSTGCLPYGASKGGGTGEIELIVKGDLLALEIAPQTMGQVAKGGGVGDSPGHALHNELKHRLLRGLG